MKIRHIATLAAVVAAATLLGGCAAGQKLGWRTAHPPATEVQVASCDAATATLTGRPDHDVAHRACVQAKVRQQVD
jgi:hypothetical protein